MKRSKPPKIKISSFGEDDLSFSPTWDKKARSKSPDLGYGSPSSSDREMLAEVENQFMKRSPRVVTRMADKNKSLNLLECRKLLGKREHVNSSSFVFNQAIRGLKRYKISKNRSLSKNKGKELNSDVRDILDNVDICKFLGLILI